MTCIKPYLKTIIESRLVGPISLVTSSNATKILDYLLENPGVRIVHLAEALRMNRHTISYYVEALQTSGLVERVERKGLRLSPIVEDHGVGSLLIKSSLLASVVPHLT